VAQDVIALAEAERLPAHGAAVAARQSTGTASAGTASAGSTSTGTAH
jgi:hypothetical protein